MYELCFLVAPFLENGATYLLSTVSVGMFVCLCVCGQLELFGIIFSLYHSEILFGIIFSLFH